MPRGGKRPGAGRKKGSATKKTRAVADRAAADGITPLEVMLEAMRALYDAKDLQGAAEIAKDAAPYVHPRLAAVRVGGDPDNDTPIKTIVVVKPADATADESDGVDA